MIVKAKKLYNYDEASEGAEPSQVWFCWKCPYLGFPTETRLFQHIRHCEEKQERPFQCATCGKYFKRNFHLKTHRLVHSKEKLFICSKCDKKFAYKCTLDKHEKRFHSNTNSVKKVATSPIKSRITCRNYIIGNKKLIDKKGGNDNKGLKEKSSRSVKKINSRQKVVGRNDMKNRHKPEGKGEGKALRRSSRLRK